MKMLHKPSCLTRNNFDLLRLLFAGTVCLVHSFNLSGFPQLAWIPQILSSAVAVKAFFVVSGFLIFMSYERSKSLASYAAKRVLRIYPAYFTIVMLCAIGLFAVSTKTADDYFSAAWLNYLLANLSFLNFLQPSLAGVFESNNLTAVNGALWTLKIEVMFYITVPLFVLLLRRFSHFRVLLSVYLLSFVYKILLTDIAEHTGSGVYVELARQLPAQLVYFVSGAFFYYFLPLFERRAGCFLVLALLTLVIHLIYPLPLLEPFALATTVVFFGLFCYAGHFGKYGDFSYGVYIVHFPIIQLLLNSGWFQDSPWYFLISVITLTLIGAILMWHGVEKWFLRQNSHYLENTTS